MESTAIFFEITFFVSIVENLVSTLDVFTKSGSLVIRRSIGKLSSCEVIESIGDIIVLISFLGVIFEF